MPDDLKYVAVAESGLPMTTLSSAGAAGLWQLMLAPRAQGLRVDEQVDEPSGLRKGDGGCVGLPWFLARRDG